MPKLPIHFPVESPGILRCPLGAPHHAAGPCGTRARALPRPLLRAPAHSAAAGVEYVDTLSAVLGPLAGSSSATLPELLLQVV
jgi:hypothetical protein